MAAPAGNIPVTDARKRQDAEEVAAYLARLEHPLRAEIEAVRAIIRAASDAIGERIKWNGPSYYARADLVTFNLRAQQHVHLVFHHPAIVEIISPLLEGDYKDRRMVYFKNLAEVESRREELTRILRELVRLAEN